MRGNLPGTPDKDGFADALFEEDKLLLDREHVCPVCERTFTTKTVRAGVAASDGVDMDLRPRFKNIDVLKYRVLECPVCGYADMEKTFTQVGKRELPALRAGSADWKKDAELEEGVLDYAAAYNHYKAALRNNLVRGLKNGRRGHTALCTAWLLRGWRESMKKNGTVVLDTDPMSKKEEMKLIKYAARCFTEAEAKEDFPINGMAEATFDYLMAVLSYWLENRRDAERYALRALQNRTLNKTLRPMAEDLRDEIKKMPR